MELHKEEVIKLEKELIQAIKTSDIDFLDKVLHDDLLFLAPNGLVITKEMDLTSHKLKQMRVDELIPHFENCTIIGDNAISIVVYTTKGIMAGQAISGQFRYIRNWKLFNDSIKVVSGACIQIF